MNGCMRLLNSWMVDEIRSGDFRKARAIQKVLMKMKIRQSRIVAIGYIEESLGVQPYEIH